ncbi:nuclear transport factor 2 family protein [Maricaulis maris]|uniref:Ketosteroid isomerase-like protein n=1 Tax=Maricaulis maris TaxID=74318 RepID=A0A495D4H6_9PROT|nr:nuclear transport factor 2 family protein [Maricaulis maris]RKQ96815.1 ketosteroid isomerase-like protein [Maricaulis maris]
MTRMTHACLLATCLLTAAPSAAQSTPDATPRHIAEAWLDAYASQNFAAMSALMTEDTRFIDPTSFDIDAVTERIEWRGPAAITAGIAAWGMDHGVYTIDRTYEASGQVVFNGHMDVVYGTGDDAQTFRYPITTIIAVVDGHVAEHRDYTDFNNAAPVQASH